MKAIQQQCRVCGKIFLDRKHPDKFLCSRECSGIDRRTVPFKKCPTCGKTHRKPGIYCDVECAKPAFGHRKGKIFTAYIKECVICGKPFKTVPTSSKQHTCGYKCMALRKSNLCGYPKKFLCAFCGKECIRKNSLDKRKRFCNTRCAALWRAKYIDPIKRPNHKRHKMEAMPRTEMKKCSQCEYNKMPQILERHHLDHDRTNNSPENLACLCPNCHKEEHYKNGGWFNR